MTSASTPPASAPPRRGLLRYGVEAPYVPAGMALGALVAVVLSVLTHNAWWLIAAVVFAAQALLFLHTTLLGKLAVWDELLDGLGLRGDERVLDLGCGRGAVLIAAATRLPRGAAEGVDLWRSKDQSGNDIATAQANADVTGVGDRVVLHTADMTALPFDDATFDVVTSALAVHNIPTEDGRRTAIEEAVRVLRPGGRLVVADISHTTAYAGWVQATMTDVSVRGLGWRYWYGGPWVAARLLAGTKR